LEAPEVEAIEILDNEVRHFVAAEFLTESKSQPGTSLWQFFCAASTLVVDNPTFATIG
jgi:hypothetical protein